LGAHYARFGKINVIFNENLLSQILTKVLSTFSKVVGCRGWEHRHCAKPLMGFLRAKPLNGIFKGNALEWDF